MSCGAETEANALLVSLLAGTDFTIPDIDISGDEYQVPGGATGDAYQPVTRPTINQVTDGTVDGLGAFDKMMKGFSAHLQMEYDTGRITGAEYAKTYIALTQQAMQSATAFVLGKDQSFWQAALAQAQAITARVALATAKVQMAQTQIQAQAVQAEYALTKLKLATESIQYCIQKTTLDDLLPLQVVAQSKQNAILAEQLEAARAQTLDTRSDGVTVVAGSVGMQKALYTQQITSYTRDAEMKFLKVMSDAWITQKTIDDAVLPPDNFTNANIDAVMTTMRSRLNLP